jgi:alpha-beta hydrolase superfamily lysophospholipase
MAFDAMRHVRPRPPPAEWGDLIRAASPLLWHGAADTIVAAPAMKEAAKQWQDALGLTAVAARHTINGISHAAWAAQDGRVCCRPNHCRTSDTGCRCTA